MCPPGTHAPSRISARGSVTSSTPTETRFSCPPEMFAAALAPPPAIQRVSRWCEAASTGAGPTYPSLTYDDVCDPFELEHAEGARDRGVDGGAGRTRGHVLQWQAYEEGGVRGGKAASVCA